MHTADLVVAIEPLSLNFRALRMNIKLNDHMRKVEAILVDKTIAELKGKAHIYLPITESGCLGAGVARIESALKQNFARFVVGIDTLNNILSDSGVENVDLMKISIEDYVLKALPGMINTLRKTKWLIIELWQRDLPAIRVLRHLGFHLIAQHGKNFLFRKTQ